MCILKLFVHIDGLVCDELHSQTMMWCKVVMIWHYLANASHVLGLAPAALIRLVLIVYLTRQCLVLSTIQF